jgi:hypothetical protein
MESQFLKSPCCLYLCVLLLFPGSESYWGSTIKNGPKVLIWMMVPGKKNQKKFLISPIGNSYYEGPADAKVTIIEWMDYQ